MSKNFGTRPALRDVTFSAGRGRLTGFVGGERRRQDHGDAHHPRCARRPTAASVTARWSRGHGGRPAPLRVHARGARALPEDEGRRATRVPRAAARDLHRAGRERRPRSCSIASGSASARATTVERLSLGNQQRAQIAAALVHEPEGAGARRAVLRARPDRGRSRWLVGAARSVADAGAPVLFSSHQLDVVERLCDDLVIIAAGEIRAAGSREDLRAQNADSRFEIATGADVAWLREDARRRGARSTTAATRCSKPRQPPLRRCCAARSNSAPSASSLGVNRHSPRSSRRSSR